MRLLFEKQDLVYVCSPLSASNEDDVLWNMIMARKYSDVIEKILGCRAIAPHSFLPQYLDDHIPEERQVALEFGLSVLKLCKAMVVCGDVISNGMRGEIAEARRLGITVYRLPRRGETPVWREMEALEDEMQVCKDNIPE